MEIVKEVVVELHNIINCESELKEFLDFLPDGDYFVSLLARRKWFKDIPSNNQQLRRFVSSKKHLIDKIRQMECRVGCYKVDDLVIPNSALGLYISVNPRDLFKASGNILKKLAEIVVNGDKTANPLKIATNIVQTSSSDRKYLIFDIDDKNPEILQKAFDIVGKHPYIETRGGYHLLVEPSKVKEPKSKWYQELLAFSDIAGDSLSPVPGTTQGDFTPKFIND